MLHSPGMANHRGPGESFGEMALLTGEPRSGEGFGYRAHTAGVVNVDMGQQDQLRRPRAQLRQGGQQIGDGGCRSHVHDHHWIGGMDPGPDETFKTLDGHGQRNQIEVCPELLNTCFTRCAHKLFIL